MQEQPAASRRSALERAQWLRAAILGANDGLLSTTSLILGVGAAKEDRESMVLSGIAGAIAGSFSMAVGEFMSVSTQRDIEMSMRREKAEPEGHESRRVEGKNEDNNIELSRGDPCDPSTTRVGKSPVRVFPTEDNDEVNKASDKKDEGEDGVLANPYTAALASSLAFLCGAIVPILSAVVVPNNEMRVVVVTVVSSIALALFGGLGAYIGGSHVRVSATRVLLGGWVGMGITYGFLKIFDTDDH